MFAVLIQAFGVVLVWAFKDSVLVKDQSFNFGLNFKFVLRFEFTNKKYYSQKKLIQIPPNFVFINT